MTGHLGIRGERRGDPPIIADVVRRAYAGVPHSDHREHLMVERLRATSAFVPDLSLVAERNAVMVGHLLLVRVGLADGTGPRLLALAPLSVLPCHQGRGVGRAMVRASHERAFRLGFAAVVVIGTPGYYGRLGYGPLDRTGLALPFPTREADRLVRLLAPDALADARGVVAYPPAWLEH